jgi:hypothetical protein
MQYGRALVFLSLAIVAGCGGGATEQSTTTTTAASTTQRREEAPLPTGASITGLMGTISQDAVQSTLEPRMDSFMHCFETRLTTVRFLGGNIRLAFRVHTDGTVMWVYPAESSLGDRDVETCIMGVAQRAHFPHPHGGEAEFSWGFALDPPSDVRAPIAFASGGIDALIEAQEHGVRTACGQGPYHVTAYVQPGGAVLAAGVATDSTDAAARLDCVAGAVRAWHFPDPGSYAGKVSFTL